RNRSVGRPPVGSARVISIGPRKRDLAGGRETGKPGPGRPVGWTAPAAHATRPDMAKHDDLDLVASDARAVVHPFRVTKGRHFRLHDVDPGDTRGLDWEKKNAPLILERGVARLAEMQEKLYAQDRWGVLLIFQAMDAAGKDGTIKHVMSGV